MKLSNSILGVSFFGLISTLGAQELAPTGLYPRADAEAVRQKLLQVNYEDTGSFAYEISGQTSINLKAKPNNGGASTTFVTRNEAANANAEIAYGRLAQMLGVDQIIRTAVPYSLGPRANAVFENLIRTGLSNGSIHGNLRTKNANAILGRIDSNPNKLQGCLKEKKKDDVAIDLLASNNHPNPNHQIFKDLQASNSKPSDGKYDMGHGYWAERKTGARQYSILMTLDTVFGQWDRYSGGNVVYQVTNASTKEIRLLSTDNGGADYWGTGTTWGQKQASWFSRYDKGVIDGLRTLQSFLTGRTDSLTVRAFAKTYTNPNDLVVDMGLYYELSPAAYVKALAAHIDVLLRAVDANERRYGAEAVYF